MKQLYGKNCEDCKPCVHFRKRYNVHCDGKLTDWCDKNQSGRKDCNRYSREPGADG